MSGDVEVLDAPPKRNNGHGGARAGACRKPRGYEPPKAKADFDEARARNESAKADLAELEYKRRSGLYVARAAVRDASAHALASVAQSLRSIPDTLERKFNLSPVQAEAVAHAIDGVLNELADEFEQMAGAEPEEGDADE